MTSMLNSMLVIEITLIRNIDRMSSTCLKNDGEHLCRRLGIAFFECQVSPYCLGLGSKDFAVSYFGTYYT